MLAKSKYLVFTQEIIFPLCILGLVAILAWLVFYSSVFTIRTIVCQSDYRPCANPAVLSELDKQKGQNIFKYNPTSLEDKLLAGDYMQKSVHIQKTLPDVLKVELLSVNPSFALRLQDGTGDWIVCDQEGRVIGSRNLDPNVITILVENYPALHIGQPIPEENMLNAGKLVLLLKEQGIIPSQINYSSPGQLKLKLNSGLAVLLTTSSSELDRQVTSLQAALLDSTIIKEANSTLDVRFAQPILKQN